MKLSSQLQQFTSKTKKNQQTHDMKDRDWLLQSAAGIDTVITEYQQVHMYM